MKQTSITLIDSNSEAFPAGSHVSALAEPGVLTTLAGYEVEDITYSHAAQRIHVRTALGYRFTISTGDYDQLVNG